MFIGFGSNYIYTHIYIHVKPYSKPYKVVPQFGIGQFVNITPTLLGVDDVD